MKLPYPEQEMIHDYVRDKLDGDNLAIFECWLLDNPEQLSDIETMMAVRTGIRQGAAFDLSSSDMKRTAAAAPFYKKGWFAAVTASVCVVLIAPIFLIFHQQQTSQHLLDQIQALQAPSGRVMVLPLVATRSIGGDQTDGTIYLDGESTTVVLEISVSAFAEIYSEFEILLTLDEQRYSVEPRVEGKKVQVKVLSDWLDVGTLELQLYGRNQTVLKELSGYTVGIEKA